MANHTVPMKNSTQFLLTIVAVVMIELVSSLIAYAKGAPAELATMNRNLEVLHQDMQVVKHQLPDFATKDEVVQLSGGLELERQERLRREAVLLGAINNNQAFIFELRNHDRTKESGVDTDS